MTTDLQQATGGAGTPAGSIAEDVAKVGGIEEEFLFGGTATQYRLAGRAPTDYSTDGHWDVEPDVEQPFRTRMIVVRPADPAACNGTVFVLWNNVSSGESFMGGPQAAQLLEDGFVVVGVSAQRSGVEGLGDLTVPDDIEGLPPMPRALGMKESDPERYGTMSHPGDGFSYDIFTQAARLVGPDRPRNPDPLGGVEVRHLVATGGSQSANRLATYVNAVQPVAGVLDGFLLTVYAGCPCALDPASAPATLPELPVDNVVELLPWRTYRLRDDLDVPIIVLNSEFEAEQCHPNTNADTELLRWWEVAGTAHGGLMPIEMVDMVAKMMPEGCWVSFAPASRAAMHGLRRWLDGGAPPPHQPRLAKTGEPPALPRDEHGNALGGIRWPDLEAPLGTYVGQSPPGVVQLMGHSSPFTPEQVRALYADRDAWQQRYDAAVDRLVDAEVVLPDAAVRMKSLAAARDLPF